MENDLRQAIERGELSVSLSAHRPCRGRGNLGLRGAGPLAPSDPRRRSRPTKFIPLAEEAGLIGKIGEWVLRTALEEAAQWPDPVRVAVNLSPLQFNDPKSPRWSASTSRKPASGRAAGAGDHRRRVPGRGRFHRRDVRQAEGARRPARARRFRHRLQLARLFEEGAVRQDQDRPELRSRRRFDRPTATRRSSAPS